jgi:hypothetical protein
MTFEATCERCGEGQELTEHEQAKRIGRNGSFMCDGCLGLPEPLPPAKRRRLRRRLTPDPWRRSGCIVTARRGTRVWTCHRDGKVEEALAEICRTLPEGTEVLSISTWRSILRDLIGPPRTTGQREIDAYGVERTLLAKVGRLDLLPVAADPLYDQAQRERKSGRGRRSS